MKIRLRRARKKDVNQVVMVDNQSWPRPLWTSREQFLSRLKTFPEGFIVADNGGHIIGVITSMRTRREWIIREQPSWREVTDDGYIAGTHDPGGDCLFLIAVNVSPEVRGVTLGNRLIDAEIELAASLEGIESVLGYTRVPRYKRFAEMPIDRYIKMQRRSGEPYDSVLRFHVRNGAEILHPIKDGRPEDADSLGYGVLISYDAKLRERKRTHQKTRA